ncbi:TonB-dependent receptor [Aliiglaciecola sp. 3_MG-2023]|uniref:TonB-dependent receptor n=1 Tax=Aliiglaciecola sp. 3_MG-2023 TaxID=3062644 RepID=UPI0026E40222|nr:TonB-dependent receptor [Aliiglaciecola sp. 3_MG-2023]MDO6693194.1 TonB-dependent receptor [Aliiglaciecola sp. 3_MG-2023]
MKLPKTTISTIALCVALSFNGSVNAQQVDNLSIQSTTLDNALLSLAQHSEIQILFSDERIKEQLAPKLEGSMDVQQALATLLEGTGFTFKQTSQRTYIITPIQSPTNNQQDDSPSPIVTNETASESSVERIQVTGSNIRGMEDTGALPVTTMSAEDIDGLGISSGAEILAELPQQGAVNFTSERVVGGVNDARGDVSSVNLRGIGTGYTLTLLNGRRLVLHPGTQAENLVPVTTVNSNTLPVKGIKRVEVLRDGAAAIYGTDAISGVVNYVLDDNYTGGEIQAQYGNSQGTSRDQVNLSGAGGWLFNDDKTHLTISGGYYHRDMVMASERDYAASSDLREFNEVPSEFIGDTQLDNRSTVTPWGEFSSDSLGTFHLEPSAYDDCSAVVNDEVCASSGSTPRDLRFDSNSQRSLSSEVDRLNFYTLVNHQVNDQMEVYGEALYYSATAKRLREQSGNLTAQRFTISADAFYNPFDEEVTLRRYRPIDTGPRNIEVDDYSYRLLVGSRGYFGEWDYDTGVLYSKANTLDKANRINTTLFQQAINSTDESTAYNVFSGASVTNPNTVDDTPVSQSVIDSFTVNVERESETELASIDAKISRPDLFSLPAGDVGFAAGIEFRYESFFDKRSDDLNGTLYFSDLVGGTSSEIASQILGSSPTPDASGSRNVSSAFAELAIPLIADKPLIESLNMQLAGRYENFSDVGSVFKPKVALAWTVNDKALVRGAYSGGFKAPGLPQTTAVNVARSNTRTDPVTQTSRGTLELRNGSDTLSPEESENYSFGVVLTPTKELTLTVDWWRIKQENTVGILDSRIQILYDALLRSQGSQNENVVRDENDEILYVRNDYTNLLPREISGIDYSATYRLETDLGKFTIKLNAANLRKFTQGTDAITDLVVAAQEAGNEALLYEGEQVSLFGSDGDLIRQNERPEWRTNLSLAYSKDEWRAGLKYRYVSDVEDTSLTYTNEAGDLVTYVVDDWSTVDAYLSYRFSEDALFTGKTKVTVGMRNITNEAPPFADNTFGYSSNLHSSLGRYSYITLNHKF